MEGGRPDAWATVRYEPASERSVVQAKVIEGRDWKCRLGKVGKGWPFRNEYRGRKSWASDHELFQRARGRGDETSQSIRSCCFKRPRQFASSIRARQGL